MKYLKHFNEASSYLNLHGDDDYEITQVKRDSGHDYGYCDGVLYELSGNDTTAYIEEISHTEENMFYQDQIDRYVEYIRNGGIIQTFPVSATRLCDNLEEMLEYIDDNDNGFDIMYSLFKSKVVDGAINNQKMYDLYMASGGYYNIISNPEEYGFSDEYAPTKKIRGFTVVDLSQIKTLEDLDEAYHDYSGEEPDKDDYDDKEEYDEAYSDWDEKNRYYDEDILHGLIDIIKYFEDEKEYHLLDFNHRFAALKELGKTKVYVEEMKLIIIDKINGIKPTNKPNKKV